MGLALDFSKLQPQDVIDLAIFAEREAEEAYDRLAGLMSSQGNDAIAMLFTRLSSWEKTHQDRLSEKRQALFPGVKAGLADRAGWAVELPDDATVTATITAKHALELALAAEVSAHEYYTEALDYVSDKGLRDVLETLRREELGHRRLIEQEIAKLAKLESTLSSQ